MSGRKRRHQSPSSLRVVRHRHGDHDVEVTIADLAAADGSEVRELMAEVAQFRLALDTDLTIAAAAAEAASELAAPSDLPLDLTDRAASAGRSSLLDLGRTVDAHARTESTGPANRRPGTQRRRLPRIPVAAALPIVAVAVTLGLGGGVLATHGSSHSNISAAADSSLASLDHAIRAGDNQAAVAAGAQLRDDVGTLIAQAWTDPAAARAAQTVLLAEQSVLANASGPVGVQLRSQLQALLTQLQQATQTPVTAPAPAGTTAVAAAPSASPSRRIVAIPTLPALTLPGIPGVSLPPVVKKLLPSHSPVALPSASSSGLTFPTPMSTPSTEATPSTAPSTAFATATATPSAPGLLFPTAAPTRTPSAGTSSVGLGLP